MTYRATVGWNEAQLSGLLAWFAQGIESAKVEIYGTAQPATAGGDAGAAPLVIVALQDPVGTITAGVLGLTPTADALIATSGGAVWARCKNGNGDIGFDCAVSDSNGTAPIRLPSTTLFAGGVTRIVAGSSLAY